MAIGKKKNLKYGATVPLSSGDRYYAQDFARDFWHFTDLSGSIIKDIVGQNNYIISGGIVTRNAATKIDVSACIAYAKYNVTIPDTFAATPPSTTTADVESCRIIMGTISALAVNATWTADNVTVNYIKLAYAETNGNTRARAKATGTYNYEVVPSYVLTVDATPPTAYEVELGRFITVAGAMPYYIDYSGRTADLQDYITTLKMTELMRNVIINPEFALAQRGTTITAATSYGNSDDSYVTDRWNLLSDGNDVVDISRETDAPPYSKYSMKSLVSTINKKWGFIQIIENKNALPLIGKTVSLSFQAKTTTAKIIRHIRAAVLSWSSTADTVTSDVVNAWGAEGTNPTLVANWTFENTAIDLTLNTTWTKYTIDNIAIDTASTTNIAVFIWVDDADGSANDELFLGQVQLNLGTKSLPFSHREFSREVILCERYFEKTYNLDDAPGTATNGIYMTVIANGSSETRYAWFFKVTKRISTHTVHAWSPITGVMDRAYVTEAGPADVQSVPSMQTENVVSFVMTGLGSHTERVHFVSDAEL